MDKDKEWKGEGGLRRSQRLQGRPSHPVLPYEGGSRRKRARRQGEEDGSQEEGGTGKDVDVVKAGIVQGVVTENDVPKVEQLAVGSAEVGGAKVDGGAASLASTSSAEDAVDDDRKPENGSPDHHAGGEEEAHPCVFNEDILDMVFKHFVDDPRTSKDVQTCRLVCKTWKNSATRLYRRSEHATATFAYYDLFGWRGTKPLSQFVDTMEPSEMIPVQKYTFRLSVFYCRNLKLFGDFLRICGSEAVSLAIQICFSDAGKVLSAVENISDLSMPKLKSLQFDIVDDSPEDQPLLDPGQIQGVVKLVGQLLNAANCLRTFDVSYNPERDIRLTDQVIVMDQLGEVIARSVPKTLINLTMFMDISESTSNILAEAGLKLNRLDVSWRFPSSMGGRSMWKFFQSQASTLQHLLFWDGRGLEPEVVQFPRMDELTYLRLSQISIMVEFARSFPKLHELEIAEMSNEGMLALLSSAKKPPPSLKVLHLPKWVSTLLAPYIKDLSQSFKFVVELHISPSYWAKDLMEEVFKYFDNLESLNISFVGGFGGMDHVDALFTGLSASNCNRIRREFPDLRMVNLNEFERTPSLLNLTKLKKLVVQKPDFTITPITFTDISAQFAFLEMPNLREIHLRTYTHVEFSPRYVELLKDKLVLGERNQN